MPYSSQRAADGADRYRTRKIDARLATIEDDIDAGVIGGGGGGGGAPTNAAYVTIGNNATLTNERALTAGSGISIVDNGAGNTVVISATGGTFGQATATFSGGADSVTVSVVDAGITGTSKIVATVSLVSRDVDEMEMAPVVVAVGTITAGVGFDLICVSLDGDAEGTYTINYTRS